MRQNRISAALRRLLFLLAITITATALTACTQAHDTADIVGHILADTPISFPAGMVETHLSDDTLKTLYGQKALEEEMKTVESYCIYMAGRNGPAEVALLRCYAASDTRAVSKMLLRRADMLSPYLPEGTSARVAILGRYVILAVCEDPDAVIDGARRAIRGS